ncbi:hypothetical protein CF319_g5339 [Tilletia indica]|nr:hypothetical protein CF319_g5339 [Tilletia indica]
MHQYYDETEDIHPDCVCWIPEDEPTPSTPPTSSSEPSTSDQPQAQDSHHLVCSDLTCSTCTKNASTPSSPAVAILEQLPALESRLSKVIPLLERVEVTLPRVITKVDEALPSLLNRIESLEAFRQRHQGRTATLSPASTSLSLDIHYPQNSYRTRPAQRRSQSPAPRRSSHYDQNNRTRDYGDRPHYRPADTYRPQERETSVEFVRAERRPPPLQNRLSELKPRRFEKRCDDVEYVRSTFSSIDLDQVD